MLQFKKACCIRIIYNVFCQIIAYNILETEYLIGYEQFLIRQNKSIALKRRNIMKRWERFVSLFTVLALMITTAVTTGAVPVTDQHPALGDADLSGEVEITDATVIRRFDVKMIDLSDIALQNADVDRDGEVCIIDATWIQRYLTGLPSPLDQKTNDELYAHAVRDAMTASEDEILPLVNITKDDENVIWNGDEVLVLFAHKYPDSYPAGQTIELKWGDVWCVSAGETDRWIKDNCDDVKDWTERLHQLLGMPLSKGYNTVTALWVDADLLYRPAFVPDPAAVMQTTLQPTGDDEFDTMYKTWFESNTKWSYVDNQIPWTRLGYTYDWADNGTEYGLSEFIVFKGASAKVAYTYSIEDFVALAQSY